MSAISELSPMVKDAFEKLASSDASKLADCLVWERVVAAFAQVEHKRVHP